MLLVKALVPALEVGDVEKEEVGEEQKEEDGEEKYDAGLPVTQSDDPLSGGHLLLGTSKAPPRSPGERSRVIVHVAVAL